MKKILLIGLIIFVIFQMMVMATAIDIGSAATDRTDSSTNARRTYIDKNNPANESGTITSIEIWCSVTLVDCEIATFYVVSGNNLSTRDTHTIGGVTANSKQTFSGLSIDVQTGDYIGATYLSGRFERDPSGAGYWYTSADNVPCTNVTFTFSADKTISLYGTGATPSGFTWNTKTISKWNDKTISTWNGI